MIANIFKKINNVWIVLKIFNIIKAFLIKYGFIKQKHECSLTTELKTSLSFFLSLVCDGTNDYELTDNLIKSSTKMIRHEIRPSDNISSDKQSKWSFTLSNIKNDLRYVPKKIENVVFEIIHIKKTDKDKKMITITSSTEKIEDIMILINYAHYYETYYSYFHRELDFYESKCYVTDEKNLKLEVQSCNIDPSITFDNLVISSKNKTILNETLKIYSDNKKQSQEIFENDISKTPQFNGNKLPMIFYGPKNTNKKNTIKACANFLKLPVIWIEYRYFRPEDIIKMTPCMENTIIVINDFNISDYKEIPERVIDHHQKIDLISNLINNDDICLNSIIILKTEQLNKLGNYQYEIGHVFEFGNCDKEMIENMYRQKFGDEINLDNTNIDETIAPGKLIDRMKFCDNNEKFKQIITSRRKKAKHNNNNVDTSSIYL